MQVTDFRSCNTLSASRSCGPCIRSLGYRHRCVGYIALLRHMPGIIVVLMLAGEHRRAHQVAQ